MELHYLDFDFSDEDSGRGSFDAMAAVIPGRMPALLAEISAVLRWASRVFGPPGALQDDGEWDYDLEASPSPIRRWSWRTTRAPARFRSRQPQPARH
jgi:hypothetical protein